jgi:hypothetical protein
MNILNYSHWNKLNKQATKYKVNSLIYQQVK